jgi:hypothetical protein
MDFFVAEGLPVAGELTYSKRWLSFDFCFAGDDSGQRSADIVELAYGDMVLQVDRVSGDILRLCGYNPDISWGIAKLASPIARPAPLRVQLAKMPPHGVALQLFRVDELDTDHDADTGWIRVFRIGVTRGDQFVEFASGCVAELNGTDLVALWLHPRMDS